MRAPVAVVLPVSGSMVLGNVMRVQDIPELSILLIPVTLLSRPGGLKVPGVPRIIYRLILINRH